MDLKGKNILVTGAGGFIGSHLVEELVKRDCKVKAFVHYNSFNSWGWLDYMDENIKKKIDVFIGDIRDPYGVKTAMKGNAIVFHLAALIGIPYSYHSPDVYVDTNVKGTLNILQAARELDVKKVVHTSTSEIYGTAQFVPITEEHPTNPQSPYAATKSGADFLALTFYRSFETPVSVVRPFNTYGPRQSARAIIPTIITQILSGKKEINLGSVTPTRDLNFVKDTATGFIKAAETEKANGEIINIGSNFEISVGDLVAKISAIIGKEVKVKTDEQRIRPGKSEVERLWAENKKAKELINWQPQYTLDRGLDETIAWFSNSKNLEFFKPNIYNI
ncbi:MAG TPA: NAD-dependent 4,6-dehydratase LegB [Bacteroidales bacterium]|nr:NAD-dependent 4,6-dehydratase LegB [Bacteroidales bacterium]HPS18170.1 NAD-dependent 4,6-dehydratase LegB [Bacteroidales bacterium]